MYVHLGRVSLLKVLSMGGRTEGLAHIHPYEQRIVEQQGKEIQLVANGSNLLWETHILALS